MPAFFFFFLWGFFLCFYFNEMTFSSCLISSRGVKQPAGAIGSNDNLKFEECGLK